MVKFTIYPRFIGTLPSSNYRYKNYENYRYKQVYGRRTELLHNELMFPDLVINKFREGEKGGSGKIVSISILT